MCSVAVSVWRLSSWSIARSHAARAWRVVPSIRSSGHTGIRSATASLWSISDCAVSRLQTNICTLLGGSSRLEHVRTRPHRQCIKCYRGCCVRRGGASPRVAANLPPTSEIGAVFAQVSSQTPHVGTTGSHPASPTPQTSSPWSRPSWERASPRWHPGNKAYHIFAEGQWRRARFLNHSEVKLTMSANASDYQALRRSCPIVAQTAITAMADTGAQSSPWSVTGFLAAGFTPSDLIPVSLDIVVADKSPIILLAPSSCACSVITPSVSRFHAPPWSTSMRSPEASTCHGKQWWTSGLYPPTSHQSAQQQTPQWHNMQPPTRSTDRPGSLHTGFFFFFLNS